MSAVKNKSFTFKVEYRAGVGFAPAPGVMRAGIRMAEGLMQQHIAAMLCLTSHAPVCEVLGNSQCIADDGLSHLLSYRDVLAGCHVSK